LLTTNSFSALRALKQVTLLAKKIAKQNIFWAFFYNVTGLFLAASGWLSPFFAACAMVFSSLIVLFNAQRVCVTEQKMEKKNASSGN